MPVTQQILIVDDDPKIRSIYRKVLEEEGFGVDEAADWRDCVDTLLHRQDIRLILLDLQMPRVDGDAIYDTVRLYNPEIRVIIASVRSLDEQKRLIIRADNYFDKSMGVDLLVRKVKQTLDAPPAAASRG